MTANRKKPYRFLSWGGGVQSTVLAVMAARGDIPPVDAIIHSDTGFERTKTLETIAWYSSWLKSAGQNVLITRSEKDIRDNAAHMHMPLWSESGGPLRRQCTVEFKLIPLKRAMRTYAGYTESTHPHPTHAQFTVLLGISWDESERMNNSRIGYMRNIWPLISKRMTRTDCKSYLTDLGLPVPVKSSCIACPYRDASTWLEIKNERTDDFNVAVEFDLGVRNILQDDGKKDNLFIYRTSVPLSEVDLLVEIQKERNSKQLPLFCNGYCEV